MEENSFNPCKLIDECQVPVVLSGELPSVIRFLELDKSATFAFAVLNTLQCKETTHKPREEKLYLPEC